MNIVVKLLKTKRKTLAAKDEGHITFNNKNDDCWKLEISSVDNYNSKRNKIQVVLCPVGKKTFKK